MQTTLSEAAANLASLIEQAVTNPVSIVEGGEEVAVLYSAKDVRRRRLLKVQQFEDTRNLFVAKMTQNLAKEGVTMAQFWEDLVRDEPV